MLGPLQLQIILDSISKQHNASIGQLYSHHRAEFVCIYYTRRGGLKGSGQIYVLTWSEEQSKLRMREIQIDFPTGCQ